MGLLSRGLSRWVPLIGATIVVGIGAYFVGLNTIGDIQRSQVETVARGFGKYLNQQVPALSRIVSGKIAPTMSAVVLRSVRPIGNVVDFRLYDMNGQLRGDSYLHTRGQSVIPDLARSPAAIQFLATGDNHFIMKSDTGKGGNVRYLSEVLVPLLDINGDQIGALGITADETDTWPGMFARFRSVILQIGLLAVAAFAIPGLLYLRKTGQLTAVSHRLRHSSEYDELTGTLNRATFTRTVEEMIAANTDRGLSVAVHFIDIDRFKDINDNLGHSVGDAVLQTVTERLRRLTGTRQCVARLGGDEFAVCQSYFVHSPAAVTDLADDIVAAIAEPMDVGGHSLRLTASAGYCYYPRDGKTVPDLIRSADIALAKAKQCRRGKAVAFVPEMERERQSRQNIEARLRHALANNEFDVHFQPLYEIASDRLRGFEALLRLSDQAGKPISPAEFIPIAEETGLIEQIGEWVLNEACRMATAWPDHVVVAVNLSAAQFASGQIAETVSDALLRTGLPARRLELEVTESLLITDPGKVLEQLNALKSIGVSVALDDFGTGYSSLSYLWQFPFDKLKVDKSFMTDLAVEGSKSREILATIIALGRVLDLKVTAEGVETLEQAQVLRELECDLVQGYLFGRPMRSTDATDAVASGYSGKWQKRTSAARLGAA